MAAKPMRIARHVYLRTQQVTNYVSLPRPDKTPAAAHGTCLFAHAACVLSVACL